jgi:predicted metal-dependent HD superfamily phosphohydrolase
MAYPFAANWLSLCRALGAGSAGRELLERLVEAYREKHRAYHTLDHVLHCLKWLGAAQELARHPDEVEAALWFHDVVYDPRASDNEERSAEWAEEALTSAGVDDEKIARITALIIATRHIEPPADDDAALTVDIDLAILGEDPATFDEYERRVRKEYAWVPDETFGTKRTALLEGLLARPRIYHTPFFRERLEVQARENLERSVVRLRKG